MYRSDVVIHSIYHVGPAGMGDRGSDWCVTLMYVGYDSGHGRVDLDSALVIHAYTFPSSNMPFHNDYSSASKVARPASTSCRAPPNSTWAPRRSRRTWLHGSLGPSLGPREPCSGGPAPAPQKSGLRPGHDPRQVSSQAPSKLHPFCASLFAAISRCRRHRTSPPVLHFIDSRRRVRRGQNCAPQTLSD